MAKGRLLRERGLLGRFAPSLLMARWYYRQAWLKFPDEPRRWEAAQQSGVCCRMQHRYTASLSWLERRAEQDIYLLPIESQSAAWCNLYRDIGMTYSDLGRWSFAHTAFANSLRSSP